jgi:C-3',4' desaturase CrtD
MRSSFDRRVDVAIIGAGMAGMATAARLQARGLRTVVLEAHGLPGGCAGYYRRGGFSFDVGATTLVDFGDGGVGGLLLEEIAMKPPPLEHLPGYVAWLPDRKVRLHRDVVAWRAERVRAFGAERRYQAFWHRLDATADILWRASRAGLKLPIRSVGDLLAAVHAVGWRGFPLAADLLRPLGDALRTHGLQDDRALVGLLAMLVEDTVHGTVESAPLLNASLGITIRGAGISRPAGGMRGFWESFASHYRALGGTLLVGHRVEHVTREQDRYTVYTRKGALDARQVVSTLPVALSACILPELARPLGRFIRRDAEALGGAAIVCLGVPDDEVADHEWTHHQILESYERRLGDGNNMFVSVSSPGDTASAPAGYRAVMISTHTDLDRWEGLSATEYADRREAAGARLVSLARRVYPRLGSRPVVFEIGTPRTYERYLGRPRGAVGGVRQTVRNSNQHAVPHDLGPDGFWLAGDTTWPGLGTVACVLGSRIVADGVEARVKRRRRTSRIPVQAPLVHPA